MSDRRFTTLRITLLAALGVSAAWGCGDDDGGDDDDSVSGAAGMRAGGSGGRAGEPSVGGVPGGGAGNSMGASGSGLAGNGGSSGGAISGTGGQGGAGEGGLAGGGIGGFGGSIGTLPAHLRCRNPSAPVNGIVTCDGSWFHRVEKVECPIDIDTSSSGPGGTGGAGGDLGTAGYGYELCAKDSDCTTKPYGYCARVIIPEPSSFDNMVCNYGCRVDADCTSGICLCGSKAGTCVPADCETDADCGDYLCASARSYDACGEGPNFDFVCQTPNDECITDDQCSGGAGNPECNARGASRECYSGAVCGRPFLVAGEARTAPPQRRGGWASQGVSGSDDVAESIRPELEEHWTRIALMEHASIAAFARFTLELLALGAPSELLASAHAALGDEIAHAEACFALASAYARHPVGPGALPIHDVIAPNTEFGDVVRGAFLEACIGETIAAAEATAALELASDVTVRGVLERIVRDETRHAELGWRFLRWAIEGADAQARAHLRAELSGLLDAALSNAKGSSSVAQASSPSDAVRAGHGVLPLPTQVRVRESALRDVVVACASVLGIGEERDAA